MPTVAGLGRGGPAPPPLPSPGAMAAQDPSYAVPFSVSSFISHLYRDIRDGNVHDARELYVGGFHRLSGRLFRDTPWPSAEAVAPHCDSDPVFLLLYRELWFRHSHARLPARDLTPAHRAESWDNYCSLFGVVLEGVVSVQLPNEWLWDMVDGFVSQFQSFCQYRATLNKKPQEEIDFVKQHDKVWDMCGVLNFLRALMEMSRIREILEMEKEGLEQFTVTDGYSYECGSNVLKMLGYYSMIGLLRVHCLLGDYHTGLKCLTPIDITQQGVYTVVIGSYISAIYHYGFASLMIRRYAGVIHEFNRILVYVSNYEQNHQDSPHYDQLLKKNEQMYALLAICLSLCPQNKLLDENVSTQLTEKYANEMTKMQRSNDVAYAIYDGLFSYACPKFITASPPSLVKSFRNYSQDAYHLQLKLFLYEVKHQKSLSDLRSYLKVCSKITIGKLSRYIKVNEAKLRAILMTYKHKMHAIDCDGKVMSSVDYDFYVAEDIVNVVESTKNHDDYFLREILKFEEMIGLLDKVRLD